MVNVGVFGATGYTGFEAVRLLTQHPEAKLTFATSESSAGQTLSDVYPTSYDIPLVPRASAPLDAVDAVFCCLPHGASMQAVTQAHEAGVKVIDLSADFRLQDVAVYERWYKTTHQAPGLLSEAVYGLPEIFRAAIPGATLLANPGCYPTSVLLGLYPLLEAKLLAPNAPIIADSKSGVSGAGRKASLTTHYVEVAENLSPYNIGQQHRHTAEMNQTIAQLGGAGLPLIFSPHLVPIRRGMLSTIYVSLREETSQSAIYDVFAAAYAEEPLVWLLPPGQLATMAHTRETNQAALSVTVVTPHHLIICAAIDNLGKGAAGQAVQNFNLMFGLPETMGLI